MLEWCGVALTTDSGRERASSGSAGLFCGLACENARSRACGRGGKREAFSKGRRESRVPSGISSGPAASTGVVGLLGAVEGMRAAGSCAFRSSRTKDPTAAVSAASAWRTSSPGHDGKTRGEPIDDIGLEGQAGYRLAPAPVGTCSPSLFSNEQSCCGGRGSSDLRGRVHVEPHADAGSASTANCGSNEVPRHQVAQATRASLLARATAAML